MPTPRKNRPSNKPRKGSISASSWWRKLDSDSNTPAKNAPIAIDKPPHSISKAAPSTTKSAAAVITSRALDLAKMPNIGLSSQRPAATNMASDKAAMPSFIHSEVSAVAVGTVGAIKATTASSGTISKSSNNKIDTMLWPCGVANSWRSPKTCITMAVEVSTKPDALTNATCHGKPNAMPTKVSMAAAKITCMLPSPKICRRRFHKCEGFISKPITKRNITTPNSATWIMACGSSKNFRPKGPIIRPAAR